MATVLITGASRGIGLETALAFGRAGHDVRATMRDPEGAPQLGEVAAAEDLPVEVSVLDVDSDESVRDSIVASQEDGPIDVLVNNAGIERRGTAEELDLSEFRAVMETNYFGALRCMQAVLPSMRARERGCIVNVTSVAGRICTSPLGPYAASKFALEAMSEAVAQEVRAFNVRVAIVQPGIIDTGMARAIGGELQPTVYPQERRMANLFAKSLQTPTGPALVAEKILDIFESGTRQLRHPVGPDAHGFLDWRASLTDEEWVDWWGIADDDAWYDAVERDLGMDARPGN
ncbi:MAG: oxidoreductase [Gemmatimonadota bacterium]|nr:MAG: oxidoreductase [Gemmatimonadota bacterium]